MKYKFNKWLNQGLAKVEGNKVMKWQQIWSNLQHATALSITSGLKWPPPMWNRVKSPWNHPLTPGVDPSGHAAPPEELARARRALSSKIKDINQKLNIFLNCIHSSPIAIVFLMMHLWTYFSPFAWTCLFIDFVDMSFSSKN